MNRRTFLSTLAAAALAGCAGMGAREPPRVSLVGVESLAGEGLEIRLAVKLRLQNPNAEALDYDGVSLELEVRGQDFASGVSDARGSVPRFGEAVVTVPVSVSATAVVRQVYSLATGDRGKVDFVARGRLGGGPFGGERFTGSGQFDWPAAR
jgi:LEA14-like dessication related protein